MNQIFAHHLRRFVIVFFDDILIYSRTLQDDLTHLDIVFRCLLDNQFFLKQSKCTFAQISISYLGHQNIDDKGLTDEDNRALPSQIRPKRNKTRPKYLKDYEEPIKGRRSLWITLPNFNTTRMFLLLYSFPILLVIGW